MQVEVPAVAAKDMMQESIEEHSEAVATRVREARQRQTDRQGCANALLAAHLASRDDALHEQARQLLLTAANHLRWSGRSLHRVLRLARTIADLENALLIEAPHVAEAIQFRRGLPHQ